jgi:hypothetical protein
VTGSWLIERASAAGSLAVIAAVFPDDPEDHLSWAVCASAAPHVEAVTGHAGTYPGLARQVATLLNNLRIYLVVSAQLAAARATHQRALALKEAAYGPDHPDVAATLGLIACQKLAGSAQSAMMNWRIVSLASSAR